MKKSITYLYIITTYIFLLSQIVFAQNIPIKGKVQRANNKVFLDDVNVKNRRSLESVKTNKNGDFILNVVRGDTLEFTHTSFNTNFYIIKPHIPSVLLIQMEEKTNIIEEITISTGYQKISEKTATGSFERIDSSIITRTPTFDILGRLKNATTGLYFNDKYDVNGGGTINHDILMHGLSTLRTTQASPLIVLDDFPFEGDINSINPNDIDEISLLKDAAASSIWGARAGNGVIVIKTKSGSKNQKAKLNLISNYQITAKPDLYSLPLVKTADYISNEIFLFEKGYFQAMENNRAKPALSPVVELLIKQRDGQISGDELQRQVEELKERDVRTQFLKYLYRPSQSKQFSGRINGGGDRQHYNISFGYDKENQALIGNNNERLTLNAGNSISLTDQLKVDLQLLFAKTISSYPNQTTGGGFGYGQLKPSGRLLYPYVLFMSEDGVEFPIYKDYRETFSVQAQNEGLLDWAYYPIQEANSDGRKVVQNSINTNIGFNYKLNRFLNFDIKYQYHETSSSDDDLLTTTSYFTRNLINRYTQVNNKNIQSAIPWGGILNQSLHTRRSHQGRSQLNFEKKITDNSLLSLMAGAELREAKFRSRLNRTYGYDNEVLSWVSNLDYLNRFPIYKDLASPSTIPTANSFSETVNRFVSLYSIGSFTLKNKYSLTGSLRRDASNIFGVKTNQKWTPLWSLGGAWVVSDEKFLNVKFIDFLKIRSSFGYAGNVDNTLSAYTTLSYYSGSPSYEFYDRNAYIRNPPNPELRWEKVNTLNLGIDYILLGNKLKGGIDYYIKHTSDLLTPNALDPTTGVASLVMNVANTKTNGLDIKLSSTNTAGKIKWATTLLYSYNKNIVTKYYLSRTNTSNYISTGAVPEEGYFAFPFFSYKFKGLDSENGDPIGYIDGAESKDYSKIIVNTPLSDLNYHGSSRPLMFGALRNDITISKLSISFNIVYSFKYFFRRASFSSSAFIGGEGHADYYNRWQKPGDEEFTSVPSYVYPVNTYRDQFYLSSEAVVEPGDHIRLQDLRLSYSLPTISNFKIKELSFSLYANNLGIIWRKNKHNLDPQSPFSVPAPRSLAVGLNFNL